MGQRFRRLSQNKLCPNFWYTLPAPVFSGSINDKGKSSANLSILNHSFLEELKSLRLGKQLTSGEFISHYQTLVPTFSPKPDHNDTKAFTRQSASNWMQEARRTAIAGKKKGWPNQVRHYSSVQEYFTKFLSRAPEGMKPLKDILRKFHGDSKKARASYVIDLCAKFEDDEEDLCSRVDPVILCIMIDIALISEYCVEAERMIQLLGVSGILDSHLHLC